MNEIERYTPHRTKNFVAPEVRIDKTPKVFEMLPPEVRPVEFHAPVVLRSVAVSETDRAVGFTISTTGLAAIGGVGGVLLAVVGWQVPILSVPALAIFFVIAALVWATAWLFYSAASADGIGLLSVLLHYRLLRHEQKERLRRIERMMEDDR